MWGWKKEMGCEALCHRGTDLWGVNVKESCVTGYLLGDIRRDIDHRRTLVGIGHGICFSLCSVIVGCF